MQDENQVIHEMYDEDIQTDSSKPHKFTDHTKRRLPRRKGTARERQDPALSPRTGNLDKQPTFKRESSRLFSKLIRPRASEDITARVGMKNQLARRSWQRADSRPNQSFKSQRPDSNSLVSSALKDKSEE